jgi:protein-L-isoaspartate(D-aspartate) O-methyltransferase
VDPRERMIAAIEEDTRETAEWTGRAALAPRTLEAMRAVRREAFIPPAAAGRAYENRPQAIGHEQTISQPFIVALMTDLLELKPEDVVLEVGTGSGYQAAILAKLTRQVFSVEMIGELAERAHSALAAEGISNVEVRVGDGAAGWPEHAPFDAIIVTAAAPDVPQALVDQLRGPGRMAIPVGAPHAEQELRLLRKDAGGVLASRRILPVAFVPLVGSAVVDDPPSGHSTHQ